MSDAATRPEAVATLTVQITRAATGEVETFTVPATVQLDDFMEELTDGDDLH